MTTDGGYAFGTDGGVVLTNRYVSPFGNGGVVAATVYGDFEGDGRAVSAEWEEEWVWYGWEVEAGSMGNLCGMVGRGRLKGMRSG